MIKGHILTEAEASRLAVKYGNIFIESISIIDDIYLIMTSCSIFIHNNPAINDCAQLSKMSYQKNPIAYIRRNKRFSLEYFEYSIRIGELEILATGGFWGDRYDSSKNLVPFYHS
ncbi:hypothetical protein BDF21DRAFT_347208 [Thamnidium elegans]|nr:hypothetical protein BDF21DRAFT_347208 [Thamnidium elegans]